MGERITVGRPDPTEYAPYYESYIRPIQTDDVLAALGEQRTAVLSFLRSLAETVGDYRYAPGKWTVKEVVGHVVDTERIFACRALRFARRDRTRLPGFEQDEYVAAGRFAARELGSLVDEFDHVRLANLALFQSFDEATWHARGIANDVEFSVRAIAFVLVGHAGHHMEVIRDRYLGQRP